jgi:hypothetical protein
MPLIRCSEQKQQTLEQFYMQFASGKDKTMSEVGASMLKVVQHVNWHFKDAIVFGLTSHASLNLLSEDNSNSDWLVTINSMAGEFYIEYLMPISKQPWPNARVNGSTKSFDELKIFLVIAMHESQGWTDSRELQKLYSSIKSA